MKLSIIGLGKLGSPLAAVFASKGYDVIGVDLNETFVKKINQGIAPVEEPDLQDLLTQNRQRISATTSTHDAVLNSDVTFVIVPTPTDSTGLFSNVYLLKALESIGTAIKNKSSYHLVVITSTVTPGSCQGDIKKTLEKSSGKLIGDDLGLCYNPEFIALGSVVKNMLYPDMLLVGESDKKAGDILEKIYKTSTNNNPPVRRMNLVNAEVTKISVNTYVTTKISYANMLSDICERLPESDVNVVTDAVGLDSRIGLKYLRPAVAFGGPCFPRDNIAMSALAKKLGARADLADATQKINVYQNDRLMNLIKKEGSPKKISILGLSYKPGTYVVEESQGVKLANELVTNGHEVAVFDPMALTEAKKVLNPLVLVENSTKKCVEFSDFIIILIAWPEFRLELTKSYLESFEAKIFVDCWRILDRGSLQECCKIKYLGCGESLDSLIEDSVLV